MNIKMKSTFIILVLILLCPIIHYASNSNDKWQLKKTGEISWNIGGQLPHSDHIEMSGDSISVILRYSVDKDKSFKITRELIWPMLRTIPNNTHASFTRIVSEDIIKNININGRPLSKDKTSEITHKGLMTIQSSFDNVSIKRTLFPSTIRPFFLEEYQLTNQSNQEIDIEIPALNLSTISAPGKGVDGSYIIRTTTLGDGNFHLKPGETISFGLMISAQAVNEEQLSVSLIDEKQKREQLIDNLWSNLVLETPNPVLNKAFDFAKIRASESIFKTEGGYMHGPGGGAYYAAIWANDQAEYIGPFFPFLGYEKGNDASLNAYMHFARFMNPEYKPIPSSIIAEGIDIWNGAGDRGDAAMIAYGAARFALTLGNAKTAKELWPLIEWCLEYNRRKLNAHGVVSSDSDELEGRFPAGDANLCTSTLYYDALISATMLGKELGITTVQLNNYKKQAVKLKSAIETFFGDTVEGFKTYRYYDGNDILRSWICMPLTVGIFDRTEGTIDALFSERLWTKDGLATQAGNKTFWDRSTLYALRGVLQAGETEKAMKFLSYYSQRRLLGEHVPYPVEAYPEGSQRHLSAESGLYCRIFTEGLFGIRPSGLQTFELLPRLPKEWDKMALRKINAFGKVFDIEVYRVGTRLKVVVFEEKNKVFEKLVSSNKVIKIKLL
uniref:hypothetical protein n=1 Tax=uncultured Draconibacterium sp. TaxID=1573823 RepID=UPI003217AB89